MKRIIFIMLLIAALTLPLMGQGATRWNINSRPNANWFSGAAGRDIGWEWMKAIDRLVAAGSGGPIDTGATVYYVDDNNGDDDYDGLSWSHPFETVTKAMLTSHNNISETGKGRYANRNRIYVKGDDFDEDWTDLAQKTDIIGVGSDDGNKMPRILGNHAIDTSASGLNYMGCRFINMTFVNQLVGPIFDIPTNHHGIEFIGCKFECQFSTGCTTGILSTANNDLKIIGCDFVNPGTGFTTAAISIGAGTSNRNFIIGNWIDSEVGILVAGGTNAIGSVIRGNTIYATTYTIDENTDDFFIINNTLITATTIAGGTDVAVTMCVGNIITGSDGTKLLPLDASVSAIASAVSSISGFYGVATRTDDTTTTTDSSFTGFHDEQFTTDYVLIVTHDAGGSQAAPEGEVVDITNYVATSGIFTHAALTVATDTGDRFLIVRRETLAVDGVALDASPATGSLANYIAGTGSLGTDLGTAKSLVDALGTDGVAALNTTVGILDAIGVNVVAGSTNFTSATATADRDGNLIERTEAIITILETGTTNKVTAPASTYTILDILGSDGADASAAVAGSILGAIGTNETTGNTPFDSSTVQADADGSVLERLEVVQVAVAATLVDTGTDGVQIAADAISAASIQADAIGAPEIADDAIDAGAIATDAIDADALAADAVDEIIDEAVAGHRTAATVGAMLQPLHSGTASAGAAGTITLQNTASALADFYNGNIVQIIAGTGIGQSRIITNYDVTTFIATVVPNWITNPSSDSVYVVYGQGPTQVEALGAAALTAIEAEVDDALIADNLDHLMLIVVADDTPPINLAEVVDKTVLSWILSDDGDTEGFVPSTDSLEAISDHLIADVTTNVLGYNDNDNEFDSSSVVSNHSGSILERLEGIYLAVIDANALTTATITTPANDTVAGYIGFDDNNNNAETATVVANEDGSILERLESIQNAAASIPAYSGTNYLAVTVEFDATTGAAHWGLAAETDEVLTITGAVQLRILIECTETCTGTDGGTIALWGGTDVLIAATIINTEGADATNLDSGELWIDTSPIERVATSSTAFFDFVAIEDDIGLDCQVQNIDDGTIVFHVWWSPLNATGDVAAGTGDTL